MEQAIFALVQGMDRMDLFRYGPSCISDLFGGVEPLTRANVAARIAPNPAPLRGGRVSIGERAVRFTGTAVERVVVSTRTKNYQPRKGYK